jgi:hypothetical protein
VAREEAAARARRAKVLANAKIEPAIYELLQECEAFVSRFQDDGPPEAPELLAALRATLRIEEPVREAA